MAAAAVLRDGETPFDHGDPKAPEHGPLTAGADMLTALSFEQINCLLSRMNVVRADCSELRHGEGWRDQAPWQLADLDATWDEVSGLMADCHAAWAVVLHQDGAR